MDKQEQIQKEIHSAPTVDRQNSLVSPNLLPKKLNIGNLKSKGLSTRQMRLFNKTEINQSLNVQQETPLTPLSANNSMRKKSIQIEQFKQSHKLSISLYKKSSQTNTSLETTNESLSQEEEMILNKFYYCYEILHKIGEGGHATVFKVKEKSTGKIYAAKVFKTDDEEMQQIIFEEYDVLKSLKHPSIVQPKEYIKNQKTGEVVIIEEYFQGKNLHKLITIDQYQFTDDKIKVIIKQLLEVLSYIHQRGIIHRDVTLMNVMYSSDLNEIKLIDFGIAMTVDKDSRDQIFSPTVNQFYAAPELQNYEEVTSKADSWGVGLIFLSLIKNKNISTSKVLTKEKVLEQYLKKLNLNQKVYEIISKLLVFKPENRLSAQNALLFEYFWTNNLQPQTMQQTQTLNVNSSNNNQQKQQYTITINLTAISNIQKLQKQQ